MSRPVIVIGGGGHAGVVIDSLRQSGRSVLGLLDPALASGSVRHGIPVLGSEDVLQEHAPEVVELANGLGSVRSTKNRTKLYERLAGRGYAFATVRHPSAIVAPGVDLGWGCQIMAGAVLQPGVTLAENALVNTRASVDHDCRIGAHAHVAPGVVLSGSVVIGEGVHVGVGAVVAQGVTVGPGALIAAGAVVTGDVPARTLVRPAGSETRAVGA